MMRTSYTNAMIALVMALGATGAIAQDTGAYLGVGIGQSRVDIDTGSIDADVRAAGIATSTTSADERDTAWKVFGGYQFHRNFALELYYTDFGKFTTSTVTTGPAANVAGEFKGSAWGLDAVGILPIDERFSIFGKLGAHRWDVDTRFAAAGPAGSVVAQSVSDDGSGWKAGLGLQYSFTKNFGLRLEWERYNQVGDNNTTGEGDIDFWSLGLQFKF